MDEPTMEMRAEFWTGIIKTCNESGMKKVEWLKQNNISEKRFYYWQHRLRMDAAYQIARRNPDLAGNGPKASVQACREESRFQEVTYRTGYQISGQTGNAVLRKGDLIIELNDDISDAFLARLIKAVSHV